MRCSHKILHRLKALRDDAIITVVIYYTSSHPVKNLIVSVAMSSMIILETSPPVYDTAQAGNMLLHSKVNGENSR